MGTFLLIERQSQRSVNSGEAFRRLLPDANEVHSLATPFRLTNPSMEHSIFFATNGVEL